MRKVALTALALTSLGALSACGGNKGVFGRAGPDEFAVQRRAPLVVPPDFALTPPRPGAPRPQEADSSTQALQAMFGGPASRSAGQRALLNQAGTADTGVRSTAGDANAVVVDKSGATPALLSAPETSSPEATATAAQ